MNKKEIDKSQEFIDEITDVLAEGFSLQTKSTDTSLRNYFQKVRGFLCQETTDKDEILYWKMFLDMDVVNISKEKTADGFGSVKEKRQARLQSLIDILLAFKSKEESKLQLEEFKLQLEESKLQLEELKKQTKSSQMAGKISFAGLIIAVVVPFFMQTCSHDLKFERQQFDTLIQSIERKTPDVELVQ